MLRNAASKVMWVGRATVFLVGLAVILALVFGAASMAFGANGGNLILGQNNTATLLTKLTGQVPGGAALQVVNTKTEPGSRGLQLTVAENRPSVVVNATAGKATNLNADKLDGQDSSAFQPSYERAVVVSPVGTNAQNGQALLDAIANITDASESKPYLLYVEPGTYDLGNGSLSMESWVDIEGSGELNTIITSSVEGCPAGGPMGEATLEGASNAELRFLTVRNTGTGNCNVAVLNSSASPRLTHMTVEAFGPAAAATAGVVNIAGSNPNMTQVTAAAVGSPDENSGVINAQMSSPFIEQSRLIANGPPVSDPVDNALSVEGGTTQVVDTQLVGAVERLSGQLLCFGNYGVSMDAVSCPSS